MLTGHRPQHLTNDSIDWIADQLDRIAIKLRDLYATNTAISGMALGCDQLWAQSALHAHLELWAHIPFPEQPDPWPADLQAAHRRLLARAHRTTTHGELGDLVGDARRRRAVQLLHTRNDAMIAASHAVIAVYRPTIATGGTASAWRKVLAGPLPVIHVNPDQRTVTAPRRRKPLPRTDHTQETLIP